MEINIERLNQLFKTFYDTRSMVVSCGAMSPDQKHVFAVLMNEEDADFQFFAVADTGSEQAKLLSLKGSRLPGVDGDGLIDWPVFQNVEWDETSLLLFDRLNGYRRVLIDFDEHSVKLESVSTINHNIDHIDWVLSIESLKGREYLRIQQIRYHNDGVVEEIFPRGYWPESNFYLQTNIYLKWEHHDGMLVRESEDGNIEIIKDKCRHSSEVIQSLIHQGKVILPTGLIGDQLAGKLKFYLDELSVDTNLSEPQVSVNEGWEFSKKP